MKKPTKLTTGPRADYFRSGDLIRVPTTGETLYVTSSNVWRKTRTEPISLPRAIWNWLRRRGWHREYVVAKDEQHTVRVYPWRPSPLPRRLP